MGLLDSSMNQPSPALKAQIDALNQAFMESRDSGFKKAMPDLSPELLAYITSMQAQADSGGNGMLRGYTAPDGNSRFHQYANYAIADPNANPEAQTVSTDPGRVDWSKSGIQFGINTDTSNHVANYGSDGKFAGYEQLEDGSSWRDFLTAAAIALGGYYGGTYLSEAGAAGAGGEALSGMDLAADAALGTGNNIMTAGEALSGGTAAAGASGAEMSGSSGGSGAGGGTGGSATGGTGNMSLDSLRASELATYGTNGTMPASAASVGGNMSMMDWANVYLNGTTGTSGLISSGGGTTFGMDKVFSGMTTKDWISVVGTGLQYLDQRKQQRDANARTDAQRAENRKWDLEDRAYLEKLQKEKWARIGGTGGGLLNSAMTRVGG